MQLAIRCGVVSAVEVDPAVAEETVDDRKRLLEAAYAVIEGGAKGVELSLVPARADPQDQPAARGVVNGGRHLGQHRGIVETHAGHQGADLDAPGDRRQGGQQGPCLPRATRRSIGESVEQVVSHPH